MNPIAPSTDTHVLLWNKPKPSRQSETALATLSKKPCSEKPWENRETYSNRSRHEAFHLFDLLQFGSVKVYDTVAMPKDHAKLPATKYNRRSPKTDIVPEGLKIRRTMHRKSRNADGSQ